jgi:carbamate kinase
VPSPTPQRINNIKIVKQLAKAGNIVVTVGGGGIPVVEESDYVRGVEAVIDKDLASALCAIEIGADEFYILTDVPKVYINFRKENEKALDTITVAEAKQYLQEGHFAEGSMAPKIRAAIIFVENGGKECIITEAGQLDNPNCGTRIVK